MSNKLSSRKASDDCAKFPSKKHVNEIRNLLVEYGAIENDREMWNLQLADATEETIKSTYRNVDKDYNPWSGHEAYF